MTPFSSSSSSSSSLPYIAADVELMGRMDELLLPLRLRYKVMIMWEDWDMHYAMPFLTYRQHPVYPSNQ